MKKKNIEIPTEAEWEIMEVVWSRKGTVTSAEIVDQIQKNKNVSKTTVRVLVKRLVSKGLLEFTIDEHDSRVYHYKSTCSKKDCQAAKSRDFVKNYFGGNSMAAIAALVGNDKKLSDKQLNELQKIIDEMK